MRTNAAGVTPWLWCPNGTSWALRWGAMTWAEVPDVMADLPAALTAPDKRAALAAIGHTHLSRDIGEPELKAVWCPHWAAMQASKPMAQRWVVAPALVTAVPAGTRPAYPWTNGVRGTTSTGRATAGARRATRASAASRARPPTTASTAALIRWRCA